MSETWIVAHDFSPCSDAAALEAARLLGPMRGTMRLLHVHAPVLLPPQEAWGETTFELENALRRRLGSIASFLETSHPGMTVEVSVTAGDPAHAILDEARRNLVHHIVVGTHARHGLSHAVLGSVAESVVRDARVPVLVVKEGGGEPS